MSVIPMSYAVSERSDAGVLPGSIFYSLDLLLEKVELFFAFGAERKTEVMISIADERMHELGCLDGSLKRKFSETLMSQHISYLDMAEKTISESTLDSSVKEELLESMNASADTVAVVFPDDIYDDNDNNNDNNDIYDDIINSDLADVGAGTLAVSQLSELQETACMAAETGNTCKSRLLELNIVTAEECCVCLGACCD